MKRFLSLSVNLVWLAMLALAVSLAAAFLPTILDREALVISGGSMGRAAPLGSIALTRQVDARTIGVGDIVSFRRSGDPTIVTHRVEAVTHSDGKRALVTKGDANATSDPEPIIADGEIHTVERVIPLLGFVVGFARTPVGFLSLLTLPSMALLLTRSRRAVARGELL